METLFPNWRCYGNERNYGLNSPSHYANCYSAISKFYKNMNTYSHDCLEGLTLEPLPLQTIAFKALSALEKMTEVLIFLVTPR